MANTWGAGDTDVNAEAGVLPPGNSNSGWGSGDVEASGVTAAAPAPTPTAQASAAAPKDFPSYAIDPNSGAPINWDDPNGPARAFGGYAAGAVSPLVGGAQLLAHGAAAVAPQTMTPVANLVDKANNWLTANGSPEYNFGRAAGTYTAPLVAGPVLGGAGAAGSTLGRIGMGAATGAALGATTPVDSGDNYWPTKLMQTGGAAVVGGGIPLAGAVGRAMLPEVTPAAQILRGAGIEPTPGGAVGGVPGAIENVISKVPVIGAPINAGRQSAQQQFAAAVAKSSQDFNRATINQALAPIGQTLDANTAVGNDAIAEMAEKVGDAYKAAVPNSGGVLDQQAVEDINKAIANARLFVPQRADQFANFVNTNILGKVQDGSLPGQAFKDAESDLGREASTYLSGNSTADERKLGQAYQNLQGTLRDWLARVNPQNAADLQAANQSYAQMLRVQDAAARSPDGVFTPTQLLAATKKFSGNVQYARGGALMQPEAQNALAQQQAFAQAGSTLKSPAGAGGHGAQMGAGVMGGALGADLIERLMEHPSPYTLGAAALAYPTLGALYSNAGRRAINGVLNATSGFPSILPLSPLGAQGGAQWAPIAINGAQ